MNSEGFFLLKLQKYDFELEYAPGKTMVVSDALSRAYLNNTDTDITEIFQLVNGVSRNCKKLQRKIEPTET